MTTARGIRNRNPGNIVVSGWTQRQNGYQGPEPEGRFARFTTMAHGVEALIRLLLVYRDQHGLKTVRGIINRWAPPVENDTGSYVLSVAKMLNVTPDDELPADPQVYRALAKAIVGHENGRDAANAVTDEDYDQAMVAAFMLPSQAAGATPQPASPPAVPVPPAPSITERIKDAMSPLLIPAIAAVVDAIPSLVKLFGSGSKVAERNAKAVEVVADVVRAVTGESSVAGGAEKVLSSPEIRSQVEQAVQARWYELQEAGGGIAAARQADEAARKEGPWWAIVRSPSFVVACLLLPLVYLIVLSLIGVVGSATWSEETRSTIAGLIVGTIIGALSGYYYGTMTSRNRTAAPEAGG